jgi:hypothetical protein
MFSHMACLQEFHRKVMLVFYKLNLRAIMHVILNVFSFDLASIDVSCFNSNGFMAYVLFQRLTMEKL